MLRILALSLASVAPLAAPAIAHHSYSNYDMQTEQSLLGEVERVEWVSPHIIIWLRTPGQEEGTAAARIEGPASVMLSRKGFRRDAIKQGDQLRVTFHPLRQGNGGSLVSFTLADNRSFDRFGALQRANNQANIPARALHPQ